MIVKKKPPVAEFLTACLLLCNECSKSKSFEAMFQRKIETQEPIEKSQFLSFYITKETVKTSKFTQLRFSLTPQKKKLPKNCCLPE